MPRGELFQNREFSREKPFKIMKKIEIVTEKNYFRNNNKERFSKREKNISENLKIT